MTLSTGQTLQNRYRVVSLLGQGGMGAVYRAWDTRLNIPMALKEMVPQPGLDSQTLAQLRQQFQQEATVLARLDHPHLVGVTDFFEERGNAYLVMKFIEGESLADCIEREGALSEEQVLAWADQLLDALAYCHDQGIIHRDVKPQNVVITPDGRATLVDFGLVKLWDPNDPRTRTAIRAMGTPEYAPPEQYDTIGHTDPRSDIYGLGATLYHALTSQSPPTATQRIASRSVFQHPRTLNRNVSPAIEAAVLRAMELTVEDRFSNAQDMRATLSGAAPALVHPTVAPRHQATKVMPEARTTSPPRTHVPGWIWAVGGLTILALAIGITAVLAAMLGKPASPPTIEAPTATMEIVLPSTDTPTPPPTPEDTPLPTPTEMPPDTPTNTPSVPTSTPPPTLTAKPASSPIPPPPSGLVVENAEGYGSDAALNNSYQINDAWGANEGSLSLASPPHTGAGSRAIAFWFNIRRPAPDDYSGFERSLPAPQDWSGHSHLCVWVENESTGGELVIQFGETSGEIWKYHASLASLGTGDLCLPLSTGVFFHADWSAQGNDQIDLGAINYYGFYVNGPQGTQGAVYLDNFRVANR